jgi:hypothetical protein
MRRAKAQKAAKFLVKTAILALRGVQRGKLEWLWCGGGRGYDSGQSSVEPDKPFNSRLGTPG